MWWQRGNGDGQLLAGEELRHLKLQRVAKVNGDGNRSSPIRKRRSQGNEVSNARYNYSDGMYVHALNTLRSFVRDVAGAMPDPSASAKWRRTA